MNETKKWYIAYTRPGQEKKVTETLSRKKIESYCPLNCTTYQTSYGKKTIPHVLFCSYTFVRVSESQVPELRRTKGVINLVFWLNKPVIVPDHEINVIREFLSEYKNVILEKIDKEQKVKFPTSIMTENKGEGIYVGNNVAKATLPSLGYIMTAEARAAIEMRAPQFLPRLRSIMDKIVG